ncbi:hypothetical protein [Dactylosporangium sp. NPDC050588]|uniref:hypothetical protein n=1 Tax=Dactylosporangium sp. NPDC050588 TaxID=3157211 RepID=UPI0033C63EFF
MIAVAVWVFESDALPTPVGVVLLVTGLLSMMATIEIAAPMDDGVRLLERPRRHELDRPGWDGLGDDGMMAEAS